MDWRVVTQERRAWRCVIREGADEANERAEQTEGCEKTEARESDSSGHCSF